MQNETPFLILSLQTASDTKIVSCLVPFAIESECCFVIAGIKVWLVEFMNLQ